LSLARAYARCPQCLEPIWFPYPTRQEPKEHQHRMPKETWQAEILCTACGRLWLCRALSLRLGLAQTSVRGRWGQADDAFFEIMFECGEQNCVLPIKAYVHTTRHMTPEAARDLLRRALFKPSCGEGHILTDRSRCIIAREVFSLWPLD
jgi:hypothetical protein